MTWWRPKDDQPDVFAGIILTILLNVLLIGSAGLFLDVVQYVLAP